MMNAATSYFKSLNSNELNYDKDDQEMGKIREIIYIKTDNKVK